MRLCGLLARVAACLFMAVASPAAQQETREPAAEFVTPQLSLVYEKGLLRASIRNCQLLQVLEELAAKTRVAIFAAPGVGAEPVSLELANASLEEGLRRLLEEQGYDVFFYYRSAQKPPALLRAVWIYPPGKGEGLRPVPPEAWASNADLEASLADPDPAVREKAYEALIERPGARHRDLVLDALRGTRETDDEVRERILYATFTKSMPIPASLLIQLATADRSAQIRLMALDALAQDPAVRPVAEAALNDPSVAIRERARGILDELEHASRQSQRVGPDAPGQY